VNYPAQARHMPDLLLAVFAVSTTVSFQIHDIALCCAGKRVPIHVMHVIRALSCLVARYYDVDFGEVVSNGGFQPRGVDPGVVSICSASGTLSSECLPSEIPDHAAK
jgi:hypothetical protein